MADKHLYITSTYPEDTYIKDGDTTNPITVGGQEITVEMGDYVQVKNYQHDDPVAHQDINDPDNDFCWPIYVYTANNSWLYAGTKQWHSYVDLYGKNIYNWSTYNVEHCLGAEGQYAESEDAIIGQTENTIYTRRLDPNEEQVYIINYNPSYHTYGGSSWEYSEYGGTEITNDTVVTQADIGDYAEISIYRAGDEHWHASVRYQYPGIWVKESKYPDLSIPIKITTKPYVALKWTDPPDITDWDPRPCEWEGTVIVRKEDSPPLHRWDGEKVVAVKTRNKYKSKAYKDESIELGKTYYYGFFPYYTRWPDPDHPIRFYTFTKVIKVETGDNSQAPNITGVTVENNTATVTYTLYKPDGATLESAKIYGKIGDTPTCDNTDDFVEDLNTETDNIDLTGLEYDSTYYLCIVTVDSNNKKLTSNVESCETGIDESRHLYTRIKLNGESNKYTFDQALINWYNAGLSDQRSNISGDASSHITLSNDYYKINNYPFTAQSESIDLGGGYTFNYYFSENTHTYNRDFQSFNCSLLYNGAEISYIGGGTTSPKELILTFSNNGNGTASLIVFTSIGEYMYNQIYGWSTYYWMLTPSGNNAILFHDYLRDNLK